MIGWGRAAGGEGGDMSVFVQGGGWGGGVRVKGIGLPPFVRPLQDWGG